MQNIGEVLQIEIDKLIKIQSPIRRLSEEWKQHWRLFLSVCQGKFSETTIDWDPQNFNEATTKSVIASAKMIVSNLLIYRGALPPLNEYSYRDQDNKLVELFFLLKNKIKRFEQSEPWTIEKTQKILVYLGGFLPIRFRLIAIQNHLEQNPQLMDSEDPGEIYRTLMKGKRQYIEGLPPYPDACDAQLTVLVERCREIGWSTELLAYALESKLKTLTYIVGALGMPTAQVIPRTEVTSEVFNAMMREYKDYSLLAGIPQLAALLLDCRKYQDFLSAFLIGYYTLPLGEMIPLVVQTYKELILKVCKMLSAEPMTLYEKYMLILQLDFSETSSHEDFKFKFISIIGNALNPNSVLFSQLSSTKTCEFSDEETRYETRFTQ